MKTTNIISDIAQTNPELAERLNENLQKLEEMQTLIGQVQAAEAIGDMNAMMRFSEMVAELGGVDAESETLPAPFEELKDAIDEGELDNVKAILASKPDLNQHLGKYGSIPLIWVMMAEERSPEMLAMLVEAGADVNFATADGHTALHSVGDYMYRYDTTVDDDYAVAAYLVAQGADISARNHYDWTPLDLAIHQGVTDEVHALLRAGADPNEACRVENDLQFDTCTTPLGKALSEPDQVALLLEFGADPTSEGAPSQSLLAIIDKHLAEETPDDYTKFYDGLRASRVLIEQALKPHN